MGHLKGAGSNKAQCGNQGSPSQDPRDHKEQPSWHKIAPRHFEANTDNAGSQQSGEKTTAVKQGSETSSKVKKTVRLRHSGPTQSPLRTAFPIIILHQNFGGSNHHCVSALASGLHGRGDELHAGSLGCVVSGQLSRCYNQLHFMRSDDHGSWYSYLGRGMRAFFSVHKTRSILKVFSRGSG